MNPPTCQLDPWEAGLTHDQQNARIAEVARRIRTGETAYTTPPVRSNAEYEVDGDTIICGIGGKSRQALRAERRPVSLLSDELGYDKSGQWAPGGAA